jgi:hypothetical protein
LARVKVTSDSFTFAVPCGVSEVSFNPNFTTASKIVNPFGSASHGPIAAVDKFSRISNARQDRKRIEAMRPVDRCVG